MPMNRRNSRVFHRRLYAGELESITLLKRSDDQSEGTVVALRVSQCRRGNIDKSGEPIQGDMSTSHYTQWVLPCIELRRVGVNYLNVLDRIVDKYRMWWQPEAPQNLTLSQFDNYYIVGCVRIDPTPNQVLLGLPGVNL